MEFNKIKRYSFLSMGGAQLIDTTYASGDWAGKKNAVPNADRIAEAFDSVGYVPGNIAYVNATGGNDSTAVLGNQLKPYATIGAAITAIGVLSNSAIYVAAGSYTLTDGDAPYGLKSPGSSYDLYFAAGATVDYYGTYGMYISNSSTTGNIYGLGMLRNYSSTATGTVDGASGYTWNIATTLSAPNRKIRALGISNYGACFLMRISDATGKNAFVNIDMNYGNIWSLAGKCCLTIDGGSVQAYNTLFAASSGNESTIKINSLANGTPETIFQDCDIYNWGRALASSSDLCLEITNNNNINLRFIRTTVRFLSSAATSELVKFYNNAGTYDNTTFKNCDLRSRTSSAWINDGVSISSVNAISIKIFDTYATQINGGAAVTNLIGTGNGFMIEPNL